MIHKRFLPCRICGASVPHCYSLSLGWHPEAYHDCKPVPGSQLDAAKAEIAALTAKQKDLTEQLSKARSNVERMRCNDALLCAVNRALDASPVRGASNWDHIPHKVETVVAGLVAANRTIDSLIGPDGRNYLTKVEAARDAEKVRAEKAEALRADESKRRADAESALWKEQTRKGTDRAEAWSQRDVAANAAAKMRTEKAAAVVLLREGLDTGRHCCSERADCPRCAWEEKVHLLLDGVQIPPTPAEQKRANEALVLYWAGSPIPTTAATKRYMRVMGSGWQESDSLDGPWTPVPPPAGLSPVPT